MSDDQTSEILQILRNRVKEYSELLEIAIHIMQSKGDMQKAKSQFIFKCKTYGIGDEDARDKGI